MLNRLLDRSVVFDFDRTGFLRHAVRFELEPDRPLGKVLMTGGTNGIGLAAAEVLSERGADLHLWARNPARGRSVADRLGCRFESVDLGDLDAVRKAAHALEDAPLSAIVLNAGAMPLERTLTPQGHELIWGSQVLGHLLLLRILRRRGLLEHTRILWVSSGGQYSVRLSLSDLVRERSYARHSVYANAKRAQIDLIRVLGPRWGVEMLAMHPGWVDTDAVRHSMPLFHRLTRPILRRPEEGADTIIWMVCREQPFPTGTFWFDRRQVPYDLSSRTVTPETKRETLVERVLADTEDYL